MSLLDDASLLVTPNAEKATKLYSIIPTNGNGDFSVTRATTATRTNSSGLIESVPINEPRLDYSLGSCPNILLEPQRTNLALRSNTFQNAAWTTSGLSVADNTQLGIDGLTSACLVTTSSTGNFLFQNVAVIPLTSYTFTFYVKRGTMTDMKYRVRDVTNSVDVITTTSYYSQTNASTFTRISVTVTAPLACLSLRFYIMSDTNSIGTAIITSCQLEAGAYQTSYIPTTSASVTRNLDDITRGNVFTNALITASGGTWFVDVRDNRSLARENFTGGIFLNTGIVSNQNNGFLFRASASPDRIGINKVVGSTVTLLHQLTTDSAKVAIKWNGTTADVFVNGVKVLTATSFTTTAMQNLIANGFNRAIQLNSMALFPTPLTDTQCIALTT